MLSFKGCIHISGTSPWICWISLPSCDPFSRRAFGFGGPKGVLGGCCRQWWAAVFVLGCYPEDSWEFHRTTNEKTTSTLVKNDWMLFQGLKIHVVDILLKVYLYLVGFNQFVFSIHSYIYLYIYIQYIYIFTERDLYNSTIIMLFSRVISRSVHIWFFNHWPVLLRKTRDPTGLNSFDEADQQLPGIS